MYGDWNQPAEVRFIQQDNRSQSQFANSPSSFVREALQRELKFDALSWRAPLFDFAMQGEEVSALQYEAVQHALLRDRPPSAGPPPSMLVFVENALGGAPTYAALRFDPLVARKDAQVRLFTAHDMLATAGVEDLTARGAAFKAAAGRFDAQRFEDLAGKIPIPVVTVAPPRLEWTAATIAVGDRLTDREGKTFVTIGARAEVGGKLGLLTVAHGVRGQEMVMLATTQLGLDPATATISDVWDAAWLPLPDGMPVNDAWHQMPLLKRSASSAAPGRGLPAKFVVGGVEKDAAIDSVDPVLPYYGKDIVARIYTHRCTQPGDSGAVMFDADGNALGLASMRTSEEDVPAFSLWMWMPGVLDALDAKLLSQTDHATLGPRFDFGGPSQLRTASLAARGLTFDTSLPLEPTSGVETSPATPEVTAPATETPAAASKGGPLSRFAAFLRGRKA